MINKDANGNNQFCGMCQYIYELSTLKRKLLLNALAKYGNIQVVMYLDSTFVLDKEFFERLSTSSSINEWKQQLIKIFEIKLQKALHQAEL